MDAGKAIAVLAGEPEDTDVVQFCSQPRLREGSADRVDIASYFPPQFSAPGAAHPIIAIPTTSGTASETNGAAVLTAEAEGGATRKLIFNDAQAKAAIIVLDPELTLGVPAYPTACTGMDVLTHAVEAFTSRAANPMSDALALGAVRLVAGNLEALVTGGDLRHLERRAAMHTASHMAGCAFNIAQLGLCHAMGHPLSTYYGQPHGQTLATLLPEVMRFNAEHPKTAAKYATIAELFGVLRPGASDAENARRAADAVAALAAAVGTGRCIAELDTRGSFEADLPGLVQQALTDPSMLMTPRRPRAEDVERIYRLAWGRQSRL